MNALPHCRSPSPHPHHPRQAAERAEEAKEERRKEERQNLSEVSHALVSGLMTEEEAGPAGPLGGGKPQVPADSWRGMSAEQSSAIHRERERQCGEKLVRMFCLLFCFVLFFFVVCVIV